MERNTWNIFPILKNTHFANSTNSKISQNFSRNWPKLLISLTFSWLENAFLQFQVFQTEWEPCRNIKESIFIRVNNTTLDKNIGKFILPHIWDRVLLNTSGLTLKRHAQVVGQANSNQPNIPSHLNQTNIPTHLGQSNSPMHIFTGSEHAHRNLLEPIYGTAFQFSLRPDEVQLLAGWKLVFNNQPMVCSREPTNYLTINTICSFNDWKYDTLVTWKDLWDAILGMLHHFYMKCV